MTSIILHSLSLNTRPVLMSNMSKCSIIYTITRIFWFISTFIILIDFVIILRIGIYILHYFPWNHAWWRYIVIINRKWWAFNPVLTTAQLKSRCKLSLGSVEAGAALECFRTTDQIFIYVFLLAIVIYARRMPADCHLLYEFSVVTL